VALVVMDIADGEGREVAGQRPARCDGQGEVAGRNVGGSGRASKATGHVRREYSGGWRWGPEDWSCGPRPAAATGRAMRGRSPDSLAFSPRRRLAPRLLLGRP